MPAPSDAEVQTYPLPFGEPAVAPSQRGPGSLKAEPHDVRKSVTVDVGEESWVRSEERRVGEAEIWADQPPFGEPAVAQRQRGPGSLKAEAHDVRKSVTVDVG